MISKELITQVLRMYPQYSQDDECTGNIQYKSGSNIVHFEVNSRSMQQINTYELGHKCKEWANLYDLHVTSWINGASIFLKPEHEPYRILIDADTEPEAIFKACQWILDNKDNQC